MSGGEVLKPHPVSCTPLTPILAQTPQGGSEARQALLFLPSLMCLE